LYFLFEFEDTPDAGCSADGRLDVSLFYYVSTAIQMPGSGGRGEIEHLLPRDARLKTAAASRLIGASGSDENQLLRLH
jgi:hypothetical protein